MALTTTNYLSVSDYFDKPKNNIPFYVEREQFKDIRMIDINLLHPNQWVLDGDCLARKLKSHRTHTLIYVAEVKGIFVLIDGHHTVAAKKIKGQTKVKCYFTKSIEGL